YLNGSDILIAADCVPFAYASFHGDFLTGKTLLVGCPKLDDIGVYKSKFTEILKNNDIKSINYVRMEVPCCGGMTGAIKAAIAGSGKDVPFEEHIISIKGERLT
ncbi:MAG: ferredoxin, partial [Candidatus Omnitrophica bacterium]|nr:ferredoxin [Candidatus Omnitrophota bacterium]